MPLFVILYFIAIYYYNSWILLLCSVVTYGAGVKTVDYIVEGIDSSKAATIISSHPDEVCKALSKHFESGITMLPAKGFYSDSAKAMIYFVINRFQVTKMKDIVHKVDPGAYISITEVADIYSLNDTAS